MIKTVIFNWTKRPNNAPFFLFIVSIIKENVINLKTTKYFAVQNVMKGVYLASASF